MARPSLADILPLPSGGAPGEGCPAKLQHSRADGRENHRNSFALTSSGWRGHPRQAFSRSPRVEHKAKDALRSFSVAGPNSPHPAGSPARPRLFPLPARRLPRLGSRPPAAHRDPSRRARLPPGPQSDYRRTELARRQSARRRRTPRPPDPVLELCHRRRKIAPPLDRDRGRTSHLRGSVGPEGAKAVYARTRDRSPISSSARKRGRGPWWRTPRRSAAAMVWRPPCWHCDPNGDRPGAGADHQSSQRTFSQERRRFAAGRRSAFLGCSRTTASGRCPRHRP